MRLSSGMVADSPVQFSPGAYKKSVFHKFGRKASAAFAVQFEDASADVQPNDDGIGFEKQIEDIHACVGKLVGKVAALKVRYDELVVLKATIDQFERGGGRSNDLFL